VDVALRHSVWVPIDLSRALNWDHLQIFAPTTVLSFHMCRMPILVPGRDRKAIEGMTLEQPKLRNSGRCGARDPSISRTILPPRPRR